MEHQEFYQTKTKSYYHRHVSCYFKSLYEYCPIQADPGLGQTIDIVLEQVATEIMLLKLISLVSPSR
jgi:hypothetical protein